MKIIIPIIISLVVVIIVSVKSRPKPSTKEKSNTLNDHPRYGENPIYLFFEDYILDVMGELPPEKSEKYQEMNLQSVFNAESSEWKEVIQETLNLSDTIEIAILDLWYRNREIGRKEGMEYEPRQFAIDFTDHYMKDDSKVDVWEDDALQLAKERIVRHELENK